MNIITVHVDIIYLVGGRSMPPYLCFLFQTHLFNYKSQILTNVPKSQSDQLVWGLNTIYTNINIHTDDDRLSYIG